MRISILTTITNPTERQDKYEQAICCYKDLADEVVVVDGSFSSNQDGQIDVLGKTKIIYSHWPHEWNWIELPRHLNIGREQCTGDWIIRLDIDQFIHEKDFEEIYRRLKNCLQSIDVMTFQKKSTVYGGRYYEKGGQAIAFRNRPYIALGKDLDCDTDLCYPIKVLGVEEISYTGYTTQKDRVFYFIKGKYKLPFGKSLIKERTGVSYWNYDYFFKTRGFIKEEFWRFSKAYYRYFKSWKFGKNKDEAFKVFMDMQKARYDKAPYTYKLEDHPKYIRKEVELLKPEQFGYNGFVEL